MQQRNASSRAMCAYCGTHARPNSMYCMQCGQILTAVARSASGQGAGQAFPTQSAPAPNTPAPGRAPKPQYLPPMPGMPAVPQLPVVPAAAPAVTAGPVAVPPPLPRLAPQAAQIVELELPGGERVQIHGSAVLGRMPEATARNSGAQAVTIPDPSKSVSRAHALIELHGRAVAISDSGSANGSAIERDGSRLPLDGDREISLRSGDRIWLGEVALGVHITRTTTSETR